MIRNAQRRQKENSAGVVVTVGRGGGGGGSHLQLKRDILALLYSVLMQIPTSNQSANQVNQSVSQ